jgi:diguanylate cyclase (GGDEF)-like protein
MDQTLHLPTILIVHGLITLISTLVTIFMWLRYRESKILPVLAMAGCASCAAMFLHASRETLPLILSSGLGLGLGVLSVGLFWQAVVVFEGGRLSMAKATAGTVAWFLLWYTPPAQSIEVRTAALALMLAIYSFLAAGEILAHQKREPLPSRPLAAAANVIRGLLWLGALLCSLLVAPPYAADGSTSPWFAYIALANCMLIVLSLVSLLIVAKERDEWRYRLASERDPLTELPNRRTFVATANRLLHQEQIPVSLLLFDIDHFKQVNDTQGHAAGDKALLAFARVVDQRIPKGWHFARIGGEEFACVMPRMSAAKAAAVAENLRVAISELVIPGYPSLKITVSVGVSEVNLSGMGLDMLLASADAALYRAKADGRNCVRLYEPATLLADAADSLTRSVHDTGRSVVRSRRRIA